LDTVECTVENFSVLLGDPGDFADDKIVLGKSCNWESLIFESINV